MVPFLPDANQPLRVLALGAHSDDIEIGCGGTLLQLAAAHPGLEVTWVVLSSGAQRDREARESADRFLDGVEKRDVIVRDFRNGYFPYVGAEIKDFFEELKRRCAPDLIFTHYRTDRHQDHRVVSDLTWNTWRNHTVLEYEIPKYDGDLGQPNVFVPVEEWAAQRKVQLLMDMFATQRDKHWFDEATFRALMRLRGMESCAESGLAEAFYGRKLVLAPAMSTRPSHAAVVAAGDVAYRTPESVPGAR